MTGFPLRRAILAADELSQRQMRTAHRGARSGASRGAGITPEYVGRACHVRCDVQVCECEG